MDDDDDEEHVNSENGDQQTDSAGFVKLTWLAMKTLVVGAEDDDHFLPGPRAVHGGKEQRAGQEGQQVSQQACAEVCPIEGFRRQSSINVPKNWRI